MAQRILDTGNPILTTSPKPHVQRNWFNLSHDLKTTLNMGRLTPIACIETMPGDRFKINADGLIRYQPMIAPTMHKMKCRTEWFYVPNRILWPNWEAFISPPEIGFTPPAFPELILDGTDVAVRSLGDYLGLRPSVANYQVSALPFAAYQKIYSDWYRDEDLCNTPAFIPLVDGVQPFSSDYNFIKNRNWDRDYFTSAKPFAQKGPDVQIPALNNAISDWWIGVDTAKDGLGVHQGVRVETIGGGLLPANTNAGIANTVLSTQTGSTSASGYMSWDGDPTKNIHLTNLGFNQSDLQDFAGTIAQLRQAEALQKFLEADARGGTRYDEMIYRHFDVRTGNDALQYSDYLGSTFQAMTVSEVLQTSETDTGTPQGTMAGHGVSFQRHNDVVDYTCKEHGFIIGIMSVLPDTCYSQGIDRLWWRRDRLDYPFPEFAMLGEQEVLNREIYYQNNPGQDTSVFGYNPRYAEFRIMQDRVSGNFNAGQNLDFWTLNRQFSSLPLLNGDFIESDPSDRIFAVTGAGVEHILAQWVFDIKAERPLPRIVRPTI